jgi:hypothetical protein
LNVLEGEIERLMETSKVSSHPVGMTFEFGENSFTLKSLSLKGAGALFGKFGCNLVERSIKRGAAPFNVRDDRFETLVEYPANSIELFLVCSGLVLKGTIERLPVLAVSVCHTEKSGINRISHALDGPVAIFEAAYDLLTHSALEKC